MKLYLIRNLQSPGDLLTSLSYMTWSNKYKPKIFYSVASLRSAITKIVNVNGGTNIYGTPHPDKGTLVAVEIDLTSTFAPVIKYHTFDEVRTRGFK